MLKLSSLEALQTQINTTLVSILEKIESNKEEDGDALMTDGTVTKTSSAYLTSLSKQSKAIDIAELKLKYED